MTSLKVQDQFMSNVKGPSVTTKVSPEVVPEVRKCAEAGQARNS